MDNLDRIPDKEENKEEEIEEICGCETAECPICRGFETEQKTVSLNTWFSCHTCDNSFIAKI